MKMVSLKGVEEYFSGKNLFITGGNGFMGKVLVEKILRSCPDVNKVYLLIRSKSGQTSSDRISELTSSLLFSKMKEINPNWMNKLVAVEGILTDENLGIEDSVYKELINNVNIIVHLAASIRFNDPLEYALNVNVLATQRVLELASRVHRLESIVYVSTAYSNCIHREIKETHYEPSIKWNLLQHIMNKTERSTFQILSSKILDKVPNTYTFTKALAEDLVWDCRTTLPVIIMRPSIVISCWEEPLPGWTDSLFGVVGISFGAAKGVIRVVHTDPKAHAAYIPVDTAAKSMLSAIWYKHNFKNTRDEDHIYNITLGQNVKNEEILKYSMDYIRQKPLQGTVMDVSVHQTKNWFVFLILFYLKQLLPALIIDLWLRLTGYKPKLYAIQKRYYRGMRLIGWFLTKTWYFDIDNFIRLDRSIPEKDKPNFAPNMESTDPKQYMTMAMDAGRIYLLKEPPAKPRAPLTSNLIYLLNMTLSAAQYGVLAWILIKIILSFNFIIHTIQFFQHNDVISIIYM